ncbi:RING finger protein 17 [Eumeta japonica]|uniref:RING finger protein 17 n=1 Tax=Eumeta variegata TaxID=151549 RepID=A0A4C1SWG7_EUMVA|nr:RING finger protein 17 [Eumeta japonica]
MIVGGEKSCKNHVVVSVQEKNPEFLNELRVIGPKVDEIYRRLTSTALSVGHLLENLNSDKSEKGIAKLVNDIKTHFAKLHAQVQKNESEVLKTIRTLKQSEQNSLLGIKAIIEENIKKSKDILNKMNMIKEEENPKINVSGLLESAKAVVDMPWYIPKEDISPPKLTINEDIYELLTNCITLEKNTEVKYKLLATKDIKEIVEIPAAPSAPVFPPELIRDVRETCKPKSAEMKKHKIITQPPKYRSKSGSSSSSSPCFGLDPITNKKLPLQMPKRTQDLVFVSHIEFPNNFFVQKASQQFLVRDMIREFRKSNNFPQPSLKQIHEGKILLVYDNKEKTWHRCRVMHIDAKDNMEPIIKYPVLRNLEEKPKIFYSNNDFEPNTVEEVQITHIISPDKFYIRKCYLQDTYEKLCETLNKTYSLQVMAGSVYCPTEGMVCVVNLDKYSQSVSIGGWQRAVVREVVGHGRVQLTLVDTGEIAVVHWSALRYIKPEFTKYRALAVECHLSGITPLNKRWSTGSLALLESLVSKVLKMEVADSGHTQNSLGVNLYYDVEDEKICINTEMIQQKHAISIGTYMFNKPILKETPVHTKCIPIDNKSDHSKSNKNRIALLKRNDSLANQSNDNLEAKDKGPIKLEVKILSYKSPSLIYVSLVDQQKQFRELFESIQTYYTKNKTQAKTQWDVGDRCCTICTESRTWRRAAILEIDKDNAKVFYIDFAVVENVSIERLRELPDEFIKMGGAVVTCHLSGIMPAVGDEWPSITKEYLKELIDAYQRFFITKNGTIKDKSLPVELWVYHITQGGPLEPNQAEWRCLNKKIIEQGLAIPEKSDTNLEQNTEQDRDSDDMISFLNVTGSITEWLQIETFIDESSFGLPTTVSGNSSISSSNSPNKNNQNFALGNTTLQTDEQKSSATKNSTTIKSQKILDWLPPEDLTRNEFTGVPTYIDNDAVIYLYDICQQEDLDVMRDTLDECFKNSVPKTADTYWSVGQPCIARFYLDEKFYRGRVVAVNDENDTCFVHYVDYGNEEMCSVKDMRKRLILWKLPIQAHKCVLSRVQPINEQWDRQTLDFIHKMVVEKNCFVKITGKKIGEFTPIDLKVGQLWLSEHLVDLEKAKFIDGLKIMLPEFVTSSKRIRNGNNSPPNTDSSPEYIVEDEDISDLLNESKASVVSSNIEENQVIEEDQTEPEEIVFVYPNMQIDDHEFICTVSTIYNDQFELIIKNEENAKQLDKIHKEIEETISDLPGLNGIYEKRACIALFKGDNKWYRASILQYSQKKGLVKVKYVDFGDIAIVDVSEVKETLEQWTFLPSIAISAKIFGVNHTDNYDVEELELTFMKKEFHATVIKKDDDFIYVELRNEKDGELAYRNLIDKNIFVEEET